MRFQSDETMVFKGFSVSYVAVVPFDDDEEMSSDSEETATAFPGSLRSIFSSHGEDGDEEDHYHGEVDPDVDGEEEEVVVEERMQVGVLPGIFPVSGEGDPAVEQDREPDPDLEPEAVPAEVKSLAVNEEEVPSQN